MVASSTSLLRIDMSADEVLRLPGRSMEHASADPKVTGQDANGLVVEWRYPDCVVELRHDGNRYRVTEVKDAIPADD